MVVNQIAENIFGTVGMILRAIRVMPQIWKSYHSKSTDGLSEWFILLWGFSEPLRGIYVIVKHLNIPLILQPHTVAFLFAISWAQCLFYGRNWPLKRCIICCVAYIALMVGFEVAMIYAVRPLARRGNTVPLKFLGVANAVITAVASLPQFWEIYKRKEVIGLSISSMAMNIAGGVFLILSLAFKETFDVFASVSFVVSVVISVVIVIAALVLNPIASRKRAARTSALVQIAEAPTVNVLTSGIGSCGSAGGSDLELGDKAVMSGKMAEV